MCTIRNPARENPEHMAVNDEAAAERLRREVHRQYEAHHKVRFTKTGLSAATGRARPTLDNWLEKGKMPDDEGMADLAKAVGVRPAQLWVKWLDLSTSDPLVRIADALERAYPPDHVAELAEGNQRVESRMARTNPAPEDDAARAKPPAHHETTGSGGR